MHDGLTEDDKILLAYVAGVLSVAVAAPLLFVAAVRYVPPFRRAVRGTIVDKVDEQLARALRDLPRDVVGVADAALRVQLRQPLSLFLHNEVSVRAGDAVIDALGAH